MLLATYSHNQNPERVQVRKKKHPNHKWVRPPFQLFASFCVKQFNPKFDCDSLEGARATLTGLFIISASFLCQRVVVFLVVVSHCGLGFRMTPPLPHFEQPKCFQKVKHVLFFLYGLKEKPNRNNRARVACFREQAHGLFWLYTRTGACFVGLAPWSFNHVTPNWWFGLVVRGFEPLILVEGTRETLLTT